MRTDLRHSNDDATAPKGGAWVVDADRAIRSVCARVLRAMQFRVVALGEAAPSRAAFPPYDLALVDAEAFNRQSSHYIAAKRDRASVLVLLSNPGELELRLEGFRKGADDYVLRPCDPQRLAERLRTLLERQQTATPTFRQIGDLTIDPIHRLAFRGDREIRLTPREFDLLYFLAENEGEIVSRRAIFRSVYQLEDVGGSNVVDVYIRYLRKKIEQPGAPKLLHTYRRRGYMLGLQLAEHAPG